MWKFRPINAGLLIAFSLAMPLKAREPQPTNPGQTAEQPSQIVAASSRQSLRFSAPGAFAQIRMHIVSAGGSVVYDSSWKDGNVLDWERVDTLGQPLASGSYRCVIEIKDLRGGVIERDAALISDGAQVALEPLAGEADSPVILGPDAGPGPKITMLAHDGQNGSIVSSSGDLVFRFGDFLAGKDTERMRLTPNGDLRLDGVLRANAIAFPDGTMMTTAEAAAAVAGSENRAPASSVGAGGQVVNRSSAGSSGVDRPPVSPLRVAVPARPPYLPLPAAVPRTSAAPASQFVVGSTGVTIGTVPTYGLIVSGPIAGSSRSQIVTPSDTAPNAAFTAVCNGSDPSCNGVYGIAFGNGVGGIGSGAFGLTGYGTGGVGGGVKGTATGSFGAGVVGVAQGNTSLAGYFAGNLQTTGTLYKAGGSFKIDDPLDPANKYLYHSFVESPDMKNIYDGVVVLDAKGEAVVDMPAWFEALNQGFRYQLTCLHGYAPVYIDEEITGGHFKIAGGKPGLKVSWQVTGTRHDAWANAHRIPIEEWKPATERGKYLHPGEAGQPETLGVNWDLLRPASGGQ